METFNKIGDLMWSLNLGHGRPDGRYILVAFTARGKLHDPSSGFCCKLSEGQNHAIEARELDHDPRKSPVPVVQELIRINIGSSITSFRRAQHRLDDFEFESESNDRMGSLVECGMKFGVCANRCHVSLVSALVDLIRQCARHDADASAKAEGGASSGSSQSAPTRQRRLLHPLS